MIKAFSFGSICPLVSGCIEQIYRSNNVGFHKSHRVFNGTIHMGLGSQMDNSIKLLFLKQIINKPLVSDVAFYKSIIRFIFNIDDIFQISCISERIQIKNLVVRILLHKKPHDMGANKTRSTGYKYFFHSDGISGLTVLFYFLF